MTMTLILSLSIVVWTRSHLRLVQAGDQGGHGADHGGEGDQGHECHNDRVDSLWAQASRGSGVFVKRV